MKFFFITRAHSPLADEKSRILEQTRQALLKRPDVVEVLGPHEADVLLIQEAFSYKDFRYIDVLLSDPLLSQHLAKVFTLNFDDCATGLLRGLYANIPRSRLQPGLHAAVPYTDYFNEQVFLPTPGVTAPAYLATWRGNSSSNHLRPRLVAALQHQADCKIELTNSWLNHSPDEKKEYVQLLLNGKFSLCPVGLAHSSFRIYESMALGRCPVIIADDYAPPPGPDWAAFALFYPESELAGLHQFLQQHEATFAQRGQRAWQAWNAFFRAGILHDYYAAALMQLVAASAGFSVPTEIKRWRSTSFYWSNNWTLTQRVANRLARYWRQLKPSGKPPKTNALAKP